jgi:RNA polymerase sigma-70 factor (sigma-E family)
MTVDEAREHPRDAELAQAGAASLAGLFRQHHAELVRLAVLLVRKQDVAEDVVQDVFTRLQARRDHHLEPGTALAYLRSAVLNGCRSVLRRQKLWLRFLALQDPALLAQYASAEHEVIRAEEDRQVLTALAALPLRRREVLVLRYYLGLSEAEIAETLGISKGAVKSTAARGIAALARAMGEDS